MKQFSTTAATATTTAITTGSRTLGAKNRTLRRPDEPALVARAQKGDEDAFAVLYERYHPPVRNFLARWVGDPDVADDLAADAFLKAWLALPRSKPGLLWGPWLFTIAGNTFRDRYRHEQLLRWENWDAYLSVPHPSQVAAATEQPERVATAREDTEEVQALLSRLLPKYRTALVLREYYELSYEQIAAVLFTTRAAVKSLLYRAREDFRWLYERTPRKPGPPAAAPLREAGRRAAPPAAPAHEGARLAARRRALGLSQQAVTQRVGVGGHHYLPNLEVHDIGGEWFRARVRAVLDALEAEAHALAAAEQGQGVPA